MTRDEALALVTSWITNKNLVKHMLAVEAAMGALAQHFGQNQEKWKILGLIHDADYEKYPDKHPLVLIEELKNKNEDPEIIDGVAAHTWGYRESLPEPKSKMEWSIYCCDELTGFIVAVTLIRPDKKIANVTVENVLKKWNQTAFAKGVERKNIEKCEEKLGIKLPDFIQIVLSSMQKISDTLGL